MHTLIDEVEAELGETEGGPETLGPGTAGSTFVDSLGRFRERYISEMEDDLNTVGALAAIQELVAEANRFRSTAEGSDRLALKKALSLIGELGWPLGLFQRKSPHQRVYRTS